MTRFGMLVLALGMMMGGKAALADDLSLGGDYVNVVVDESGVGATNVGGGPITISYLNGTQLAYVYCVGFFTDVYVPDDYPDTIVRDDGVVNGALVNNAGEIAWLLDNFAAASVGNQFDEQALQAAIWTVEYNGTGVNAALPTITGYGDGSQGYSAQYNSDIAALGGSLTGPGGTWVSTGGTHTVNTAALDTIDWFSPGNGSGTVYQGLVGPVPEPAGVVLLGTLLLFSVRLIKAKNRKKLGASR